MSREPTEQELNAINNQRAETRHEQDREFNEMVSRSAQVPVSGPDGMGPDRVVRVRIVGARARTYSYEVPTGIFVTEGDWVRLPGNVVSEDGGIGLVTGYGANGYTGALKSVVSKIEDPSGHLLEMFRVKTRKQAAEVYDRAVAAGVRGEELAEVVAAGERQLKQRGIR